MLGPLSLFLFFITITLPDTKYEIWLYRYRDVNVRLAFTVSRHYSDMGREVSELEWAIEIEGPPNYQGYRLNPDLREKLTKVQ